MNIQIPLNEFTFSKEDEGKINEEIKNAMVSLIADSDFTYDMAEEIITSEEVKPLIKSELENIFKNNLNEIVNGIVKHKIEESISTLLSWDLDSLVADAVNKEVTNILNEVLPEKMKSTRIEICKLIKNYSVS